MVEIKGLTPGWYLVQVFENGHRLWSIDAALDELEQAAEQRKQEAIQEAESDG